jgi:hypothetical protein
MRDQARKYGIARDTESHRRFAPAHPAQTATEREDQSDGADTDVARRLAAIAQAEYAGRRRRNGLFRKPLFAEPAWDILLDLYIQRHHRRPVTVHNLCVAAAVPHTTALRWIGKLETSLLIERSPCRHDHRVVHVTLSAEALALMEQYLRGHLDRRDVSFS